MGDKYITLIGAEGVIRAGSAMQSAASEMMRASAYIEETARRLINDLENLLSRYEEIRDPKDLVVCDQANNCTRKNICPHSIPHQRKSECAYSECTFWDTFVECSKAGGKQ